MRKIQQNSAFAFFFCLFISYCYAQKGSVTGKVTGIDGVLTGATVSAGRIIILTDSTGEFFISLNPGYCTLRITHSGYKEITQDVKIETGENLLLQFSMIPNNKADEVIVVGYRFTEQRSNLFTSVPVDIISSDQLLKTGQISVTQMLQFLVPSFNASRQVVNEPVTLRGLEPDQVLILVNGKRYHNMSFVNWGGVRGILGRGAVSNDLNSIPFSAIEKIEILRDGASAQYGSDAIAGVINVQLKNSSDNTWAQLHTGQFYKNDGEIISLGINRGVALFKKGSLNFSGAYRFQNPVFRGGEFKGTVYTNNIDVDDSVVIARNFDRNKVSNAGTSKHNAFGLSVNGNYLIRREIELFWSAIINHRTTVFTSGYVLPKFSFLINPEIYPDGYKPEPSNHTQDISGIAGVKGETKNRWRWEYSYTYGNNRGKYFNKETNNASQFYTLGKNAPTTFYTGSLLYGQLTNDIHISKKISERAERKMNLGFGAEWRLEHYRIKEGEEASWKNYNPSGNKLGGSGGLVLSPYDAISENRSITSVYAEMESEFENRLLLELAGRYENYSDFGGNLAGKLAFRYKLSEIFSVRSSLSNGFRAPSLQQRYMSFTRLSPSLINGAFVLATQGIFRNNSEVAALLGIPSLQAERSVNLSGGITAKLHQQVRFTIDAYWIQIKNRIVLSGVFDRRFNQDVNTLLQGITNVSQVQFFTNAINTRTKGVDIILNSNWEIRKSMLTGTLAANFSQTRLFGSIKAAGNLNADSLNTNTLFGREEKGKLERGQPAGKIIFSLQYKTKKTAFLIHNSRFGKTAILSNNILLNDDEFFSPKILTDISMSYSPKKWLTFTLGANNVFDVYPDRMNDYRNTNEGIYIYGQEASPFGFNGGYYFVSMEIKW